MATREFRELIDQLDALGFFEMAPPGLRDAVKARCKEEGWLFPEPPPLPVGAHGHRVHTNVLSWDSDVTRRQRGADAENLAEYGPIQFFMELAPMLYYFHDFDVVELRQETLEDGSLLIHLNGDARAFYTPADRSRRHQEWGLISLRAISMLNTALDRTGGEARDRFYVNAYGTNDQSLILLTPEMFAAIDGHPDVSNYERPADVEPILREEPPGP